MKLREMSAWRMRGEVPWYSGCCEEPLLAHAGYFYCHGCFKKVLDVGGPRRAKALAKLRWERHLDWDSVFLMWRNVGVAYARDVPHYAPDLRSVERVTYKWVLGLGAASASVVVTALGLRLPAPFDYPGRDDFPTLKAAAADLFAVLAPLTAPVVLPPPPAL